MKTIAEIRLENLDTLITEFVTQDKVADVAGTSSVYLSQIKNKTPDVKTGKRRQMGDEMARKIEIGCGKEIGWMDNIHDTSVTKTHMAREPNVSYMPEPKKDTMAMQLLELFALLDPPSQREYLANLRGFVAGRRPHDVGNAPTVAEK